MNNGTLHTCSLNNELYKSIGQIIDVEQHEQIIEFYEQIDLQIEQEGSIREQILLRIEQMRPHVEPNQH